jgi:hypothetical protein
MFTILISIGDSKEPYAPRHLSSIFVPRAGVEQILNNATCFPSDTMLLYGIKDLLKEAAEKQQVQFDPDLPLDYGFIPSRDGYWFMNVAQGEILSLPLDDLRKIQDTPVEQQPIRRPWWWSRKGRL